MPTHRSDWPWLLLMVITKAARTGNWRRFHLKGNAPSSGVRSMRGSRTMRPRWVPEMIFASSSLRRISSARSGGQSGRATAQVGCERGPPAAGPGPLGGSARTCCCVDLGVVLHEGGELLEFVAHRTVQLGNGEKSSGPPPKSNPKSNPRGGGQFYNARGGCPPLGIVQAWNAPAASSL